MIYLTSSDYKPAYNPTQNTEISLNFIISGTEGYELHEAIVKLMGLGPTAIDYKELVNVFTNALKGAAIPSIPSYNPYGRNLSVPSLKIDPEFSERLMNELENYTWKTEPPKSDSLGRKINRIK